MHAMLPLLDQLAFPAIRRGQLEALQINLTYRCNQRCLHCHVNAGPNRTEMMDAPTINTVLAVLRARKISTLDLTGAAGLANAITLNSGALVGGQVAFDRG